MGNAAILCITVSNSCPSVLNWDPCLLLAPYRCYRRETARAATESGWFALLSNALGKEAVEGKDGYTVLTLPALGPRTLKTPASDDAEGTDGTQEPRQGRDFICWEFVGASVV
jgi:hypothetical protein